MIEVKIIDISGLQNLAKLDANMLKRAMMDVADATRSFWEGLANERLHSSRADYVNGLQPVQVEDEMAVITLVGVVPNMVEQGMSARAMHEALLGGDSPGIKTAKDGGRYRSIPFRHKTPGSSPQGGTPMGQQFAAPGLLSRSKHTVVNDPTALGKAIYAAAKKLTGTGGGSKYGTRLPAGMAPKLKPIHSHDPFAGMVKVKQPAKTKSGSQNTYMTWRTISVGPDGSPRPEGKWIHPGITARNLVNDAAGYAEMITPAVVEGYINGILGT